MGKTYGMLLKFNPGFWVFSLIITAGTFGLISSSATATNFQEKPETLEPESPSLFTEISPTIPEITNQISEEKPQPETAIFPEKPVTLLSEVPGSVPDNPMAQVTSVSQLSDVQPTDWAFQALQSLVERYGCIAGYPDGTYRGQRAMTRYEFAAGLNACLDRISELIGAATANAVTREDLNILQRLQEEFASELAILRGRVDGLEARITELENNQFSTTTKLQGEVVFNLADAFGNDVEAETVLTQRIRLQLATSFTGRDWLFTRLTTGNIGNSFADEIGTNEGRYTYDGQNGNVFELDRLHYVFPVNNKLRATVMASLGGHHFYADTFNPGLEAGGGATGAISRFAERNPIYRFGLGGQGLGLRYQMSQNFDLAVGYLARGGNNPSQGAGIFNGNYSMMAQLGIRPSNRFSLGLTYLHNHDVDSGRRFAFGGTGTNFANLTPNVLSSLGVRQTAVTSNAYGAQAYLRVNPRFDIRAWGGITKARLIGVGDADILTYALILGFPDLGKEGNMGTLVIGAEPYLTDLEAPGNQRFSKDVPWHIEASYKMQVSDFISITPALIWLTSPNQNSKNDDVFIGTVRTTFTF